MFDAKAILAQEPWRAETPIAMAHIRSGDDFICHMFYIRNNADFAADAHAAFVIMMRRGWVAECTVKIAGVCKEWHVRDSFTDEFIRCPSEGQAFLDPFTALIEADRWYREHEGTQP